MTGALLPKKYRLVIPIVDGQQQAQEEDAHHTTKAYLVPEGVPETLAKTIYRPKLEQYEVQYTSERKLTTNNRQRTRRPPERKTKDTLKRPISAMFGNKAR